jgi:acetyl-CoA carboxylase carboxyl transferase subunit beta
MRDAVAREVREETGLTVEVGSVVWAGDIMDDAQPPNYHYVVVDFAASPVGGQLQAGDAAAEVRWVPRGEVRSMQLTPTMNELLDEIGF